ncbi:MAG TPA: hypothetical protein VM123_16445 [archaeon]|nr:hypothetical protein [archaeon]
MSDHWGDQSTVETQARPGRVDPGLYLVIKPDKKTFSILNRVSLVSTDEKTGKDFVDLLANLGVLCTLGPATEEQMADDDCWRELIPGKYVSCEGVREIYSSGRAGQEFVIVYLLNKENRADFPKWKKLVSRVVGKFF